MTTARAKSYRLHDEDLARLKRLAKPGESEASVIRRALAALERGQEDVPAGNLSPSMAKRMDALEERLEALEGRNTKVIPDQPAPRMTYVLPSHTPMPASTPPPRPRPAATPTPEKKTRSYTRYAEGVKREALAMRDRGVRPVEIRRWIQGQCGSSPTYKDFAKTMRDWEKQIANSENQ